MYFLLKHRPCQPTGRIKAQFFFISARLILFFLILNIFSICFVFHSKFGYIMLFHNLVFTNKDTFLFCDWVTSKDLGKPWSCEGETNKQGVKTGWRGGVEPCENISLSLIHCNPSLSLIQSDFALGGPSYTRLWCGSKGRIAQGIDNWNLQRTQPCQIPGGILCILHEN